MSTTSREPVALNTGAALHPVQFMAGTWRSTAGDRLIEEHWSEPIGDSMIGYSRALKRVGDSDRLAEFEFLRLSSKPASGSDAAATSSIVYLAAPGGRSPATPFTLTASEPNRAVFESPSHDFPQRITYWLDDAGLHARIEGPGKDGTARSLEWNYQRVK